MKFLKKSLVVMTIFLVSSAYGQEASPVILDRTDGSSAQQKFFISSPWLSFANWMDEESKNIDMYELHIGYKLTEKDSLVLKLATWKLYQPLGISWGPSLLDGSQRYPGRLRESGVGLRYQRFLWEGLFSSVEIVPMKKTFLDENSEVLGEGLRLYTSLHLGYHFSFFDNKFFIEPQIHCNYWPLDTNAPAGFREFDRRWNNFFLFEPNLYIGINF